MDLSYNLFEEIPLETGNLELLQETGEWEIGIGMLTNLHYLDLRHCLLREWSNQLEKLVQLQELYLSYNRISEIGVEVSECINLRVLHVSGNLLTSLPTEIYALEHLEEFRAQQNTIADLPSCGNNDPADLHSPKLNYLDLSHNHLESFDRRLSIFSGLRTLMCTHNRLREMSSDCFSACTHLTYLDLSHNQLQELSSSLGAAMHLTHCDLSYNNLTEIPACFFRSTKLRILKLDHNLLSEVSGRVVAMLNDLERLELQYNELRTLPALLFTLKKVVYIDISHNRVEALPKEIGGWVKAMHVKLAYNCIPEVPDEIGELSELVSLELDHNQVHYVPTTIAQLKQLKRLTLDHNRLTSSPRVLQLLPQLHFIDLSWNVDMPVQSNNRYSLSLEDDVDAENLDSYSGSASIEGKAAIQTLKAKHHTGNASQRPRRRRLRLQIPRYAERCYQIQRRLVHLAERIELLTTETLPKQEQEFIALKRVDQRNFSTIEGWMQVLRMHCHPNPNNLVATDHASTAAKQLKQQTSKTTFNQQLYEMCRTKQLLQADIRDRLFFSQMAQEQNRLPRWYPTFLDEVTKKTQQSDEILDILHHSSAADIVSEVFLGHDAYTVLGEVVDILHELALFVRVDALDAALAEVSVTTDPSPAGTDTLGTKNATAKSPERESRTQETHSAMDPMKNLLPATFASSSASFSEPIAQQLHPFGDLPPASGLESQKLKTEAEEEQQPMQASSRRFFGFGSSPTKPKKRPSGTVSTGPMGVNTSTPTKTNAEVHLQLPALGAQIESNDLAQVLELMQEFIDLEVFCQTHTQQTANKQPSDQPPATIPSMALPLARLALLDQAQLARYIAPSASVSEDPFERTLNTLYFEANQVLSHCLICIVEYLQRGLRSLERENADQGSLLDLANRDYFFQLHKPVPEHPHEDGEGETKQALTITEATDEPDEEGSGPPSFECIEDYGDLLRDVYTALSQDNEAMTKKNAQLSLKQKYQQQVQSYLAIYEAQGGPLELETTFFINDFKTVASAPGAATPTNSVVTGEMVSPLPPGKALPRTASINSLQSLGNSVQHQPRLSTLSRQASSVGNAMVLQRSSSNLTEAFNTRKSSQANLRKKLEAWQEGEINKQLQSQKNAMTRGVLSALARMDKNLGQVIVGWMNDYRRLLSAWLLQAVENNAWILSTRGIDTLHQEGNFLRNIHVLRDPNDPVYQRFLRTFQRTDRVRADSNSDSLVDSVGADSHMSLASSSSSSAAVAFSVEYPGVPAAVATYLLVLTRRYLPLRARAFQLFGHYGEALRVYQASRRLYRDRLPRSFYLHYLKVCLAHGHYLEGGELLDFIIRRFVTDVHPEYTAKLQKQQRAARAKKRAAHQLMKEQRALLRRANAGASAKTAAKVDDLSDLDEDNEDDEEEVLEPLTDLQILPVDREIAILTRFCRSQSDLLTSLRIKPHLVQRRMMFPHAHLVPKTEDIDDTQGPHLLQPPEVRNGRPANARALLTKQLAEDTQAKQEADEENARWELKRRLKDVQFRARVVLESEELQALLHPPPATQS